jgi:hypothetical protein
MSALEDDDPREHDQSVKPSEKVRLLLADVNISAGRERTSFIWCWCLSQAIGTIAFFMDLSTWDHPALVRSTEFWGLGAALTAGLAGILFTAVDNQRGFAPRYAGVVARQPLVSMLEGLNAGVVVVEARIVSGIEDAAFVRPPLVLEDAAGSRLYVPVLEDFGAIRALRGGTLHGPMLGEQTKGGLYQVGESVVFVGQVNGQPAQAPTYRGSASLGIDGFVADLAWLVYTGATRDDVVKLLQQRETSRVLLSVGSIFVVIAVLLSLGVFFGK